MWSFCCSDILREFCEYGDGLLLFLLCLIEILDLMSLTFEGFVDVVALCCQLFTDVCFEVVMIFRDFLFDVRFEVLVVLLTSSADVFLSSFSEVRTDSC